MNVYVRVHDTCWCVGNCLVLLMANNGSQVSDSNTRNITSLAGCGQLNWFAVYIITKFCPQESIRFYRVGCIVAPEAITPFDIFSEVNYFCSPANPTGTLSSQVRSKPFYDVNSYSVLFYHIYLSINKTFKNGNDILNEYWKITLYTSLVDE